MMKILAVAAAGLAVTGVGVGVAWLTMNRFVRTMAISVRRQQRRR
jgi:hypothetical protein